MKASVSQGGIPIWKGHGKGWVVGYGKPSRIQRFLEKPTQAVPGPAAPQGMAVGTPEAR